MTTLSLHELTGRLLHSFLPTAARRHNLLVNDVPADLYVAADWDLAASVLNGLLYPAVTRLNNGCIRVSAKIFGDIILLNITDNCGYNNCGVVEGLQAVQSVNEKIGTVINMTSRRKKGRSNPAA